VNIAEATTDQDYYGARCAYFSHGTAAILLGHRRSLRQSCVRLFANGGEDLEMVVGAPHLVGDLD